MRVDTWALAAPATRAVSRAGVDLPRVLVKHVCTHAEGRRGLRARVSSATTWSFDDWTTTSHPRGQVACSHQSLPPHVAVAQSPPQTVTTHTQHCCAARWGFLTVARLQMGTTRNPFARKSQRYRTARPSAFAPLRQLLPLPDPRKVST